MRLAGVVVSRIPQLILRYVGTLNEINPEASTIALENVVSHGTEGRRGNPIQEIPPSANVYEYIVFRGSDVKDITVAEDEPEAPPQPQMPNDPAILGVSSPFFRPLPTLHPPLARMMKYHGCKSQTCSECATEQCGSFRCLPSELFLTPCSRHPSGKTHTDL